MGTHSFTSQEGIGRAIIVITDGEDHEGGAVEAAQKAKKLGMRVFVLGIGSPSGAPVPDGQGGYMKDNSGNTVMSALNEDMCKQVAEAGGGAYIHVENNSNAQEQLNSELAKLSQKEMESVVYSDYDEQFQAFGLIALLLLIAEVCLLECRSPLFKNVSLFSRKKRIVTITALVLLSSTAFAQTDRQYVRDGNKAFRAGDYANAEVAYRKAVEKNPRNPQAVFNLGNALFAQKKDSAAVQQYEQAAKLETNPKRRAMSYHNIGVVCQSHKMYSEAIDAYKEALRLTPNDDETRYNLALCKRQQKNQNKQDQNKQQQKQDNKDKNKDNKDKQQQDKQQKQQDKQKQENKDKMSKENAEQLLNAAVQQEKNTQERMKKAMRQPNSRKLQKNW